MTLSYRKLARQRALQALYEYFISLNPVNEIAARYLLDVEKRPFDVDYFHLLLNGVVKHQEEIDSLITACLNRKLSEVTPIELCLLRLATFELLKVSETPFQVVINEAVELNKKFGTQEGFKFVNGVLDCISKKLRANT